VISGIVAAVVALMIIGGIANAVQSHQGVNSIPYCAKSPEIARACGSYDGILASTWASQPAVARHNTVLILLAQNNDALSSGNQHKLTNRLQYDAVNYPNTNISDLAGVMTSDGELQSRS
jgi:hypothetical protein